MMEKKSIPLMEDGFGSVTGDVSVTELRALDT